MTPIAMTLSDWKVRRSGHFIFFSCLKPFCIKIASCDINSSEKIAVLRCCTTVSVGALHPGFQCWHAPASAFRQPSPTCRTAFPAQHLRPSGVFSCQPDGLKAESHSRILSGIQRAALTVLSVYLKRTCSRVTSRGEDKGGLGRLSLPTIEISPPPSNTTDVAPTHMSYHRKFSVTHVPVLLSREH